MECTYCGEDHAEGTLATEIGVRAYVWAQDVGESTTLDEVLSFIPGA